MWIIVVDESEPVAEPYLPGMSAKLGAMKKDLKLASDVILLAIIFNTFCNTFKSGFGVRVCRLTSG